MAEVLRIDPLERKLHALPGERRLPRADDLRLRRPHDQRRSRLKPLRHLHRTQGLARPRVRHVQSGPEAIPLCDDGLHLLQLRRGKIQECHARTTSNFAHEISIERTRMSMFRPIENALM